MARRVISLLRSNLGRVWSEADSNHRAGFMSNAAIAPPGLQFRTSPARYPPPRV